MSFHLFGAVLTADGIAANNRGENEGNVSTLQKVLRRGEIYTTVSAEAIRYAMREYWTARDYPVNRKISGDGSAFADPKFKKWENYADDDLFGFMDPNKETHKRRGVFEISRAVSTRPWAGDVAFNVASVGAHPRAGGNKDPIPYSTEIHATRYQFLFALTPGALADRTRAGMALEAVQNLSRVAGNHSRYLYEFAPEAVVLRWTHDPVPRMTYCYDEDEHGAVSAEKLLDGIRAGDLDAAEIIAGGRALGACRDALRTLGVSVHEGVKPAFQEMRARVAKDLGVELG